MKTFLIFLLISFLTVEIGCMEQDDVDLLCEEYLLDWQSPKKKILVNSCIKRAYCQEVNIYVLFEDRVTVFDSLTSKVYFYTKPIDIEDLDLNKLPALTYQKFKKKLKIDISRSSTSWCVLY